MRLLYLAGIDLSLTLGHAVHVRRLCEALERRGHVLHLVTRAPACPLAWSGPSGGMTTTRALAIPKLRHLTAEVHSARLLASCAARFQPDVVIVREEALTLAPLLWRGRGTVPMVVECNGPIPEIAAVGGASARRVALLRAVSRRLLRTADAVAAVTGGVAEFEIRELGLDPDRVFVVPNGAWVPPALGAEAMRVRRARGVPDESFLVAFAGNMNAYQGVEVLLQALHRIERADVRAWIIGGSPERAGHERLARSLGLSSGVDFLGGLPEEEAVRHLQAAQLVAAPFLRNAHEAVRGEGLKVLQGLASDRPMLLSCDDGLRFLEGNAAIGWVESGDVAAWAGAIASRAEAWDGAGRPLSGWPWPEGASPGRRFIVEHRTWDHTAAAWEVGLDECRSRRRD